MPNRKRKIEIFSAGCPCCEDVIAEIKNAACLSCDVTVLDMKQPEVAERAKRLGVKSVPAVAIDGRLAGCCSGRGPPVYRSLPEGAEVEYSVVSGPKGFQAESVRLVKPASR